jgi:hypothetical protein
MKDRPRPKTLKSLRGILGLIGYYRKFVQNYGKIVASLNALLKKNVFSWNLVDNESLQDLKEAMCMTLILIVLNFTKNFVLECDAYRKGIGVVLMQDGKTSAFTRKQLCKRHLRKSTYEKEMLAILHVVDLRRPYFLGKHFQIKNDHRSLNYFLE